MPTDQSRFTGRALVLAAVGIALAALASVLVLAKPTHASASPAPSKPTAVSAAATRISARSTRLGKLLVNSRGDVLYAFGKDSRNKDRCAGIHGCTQIWPLVTSHGKPVAGSGVKQSLLGTIKVQGQQQVTYAGHPLYGYIEGGGPGDTSYVGISQFGAPWPAVTPAGKLVK